MTENKTYNPNVGEALYGSVVGLGRITKEFLTGFSLLPVSPFGIPTAVRMVRTELKEGKEKKISFFQGFREFLLNNPFYWVGALVGGHLVGRFSDETYHFVREHPYSLAVPLATNALSAGYERFRIDKERELESRVE